MSVGGDEVGLVGGASFDAADVRGGGVEAVGDLGLG